MALLPAAAANLGAAVMREARNSYLGALWRSWCLAIHARGRVLALKVIFLRAHGHRYAPHPEPLGAAPRHPLGTLWRSLCLAIFARCRLWVLKPIFLRAHGDPRAPLRALRLEPLGAVYRCCSTSCCERPRLPLVDAAPVCQRLPIGSTRAPWRARERPARPRLCLCLCLLLLLRSGVVSVLIGLLCFPPF